MKKNKNLTIFLIILLAAFLRIYLISQSPHGFNADEAAIGYNVYSLLKTGKDEHGNSWPLHFQSFGDYKPGGYFYLSLPFIALFGPSEISVRLPSLFAGVLSVFLIYLLAKEMVPKSKNVLFAQISALLLAVSPWHIHFSRGAWETNVATTFLLLASWLFLRGIGRNSFNFLLFSLVGFVFSAYVYHSARIVAPLLLFLLVLIYQKKFFSLKRKILIFGFVGLLISLPLVVSLFKGGALSRFSGVGIISDVGPFWKVNRLRGEHGVNINAWWVRLLHNRPVAYSIEIFKNWARHFDGRFLFIDGDSIERSHCGGIGQLYYLDFFLLLAGIYYFFKNYSKSVFFVFSWLAIGPIPAALTFQTPHALRSHSMIVPLILIEAYGLACFLNIVKGKKKFFITARPRLTLGVAGAFLFLIFYWQILFFSNQYFVHYPARHPQVWEDGMEELVSYLKPIKENYQKIYVTDRYDQPYILFLFYLKYPPEKFQQEGQLTPRDKFGFSTVRDFDQFHFEAIDWQKLKNKDNILVVGTDGEIPQKANIIKTIYFKNGQPAFKIAEL